MRKVRAAVWGLLSPAVGLAAVAGLARHASGQELPLPSTTSPRLIADARARLDRVAKGGFEHAAACDAVMELKRSLGQARAVNASLAAGPERRRLTLENNLLVVAASFTKARPDLPVMTKAEALASYLDLDGATGDDRARFVHAFESVHDLVAWRPQLEPRGAGGVRFTKDFPDRVEARIAETRRRLLALAERETLEPYLDALRGPYQGALTWIRKQEVVIEGGSPFLGGDKRLLWLADVARGKDVTDEDLARARQARTTAAPVAGSTAQSPCPATEGVVSTLSGKRSRARSTALPR